MKKISNKKSELSRFGRKNSLKKAVIGLSLAMSIVGVNTNAQSFNDRVLVIINDDVITQSEFDFRLTSIRAEIAQTGQQLPDDVSKQLLDSMINDRLQLQEAERRSIEASEEDIDAAIERFAKQQGQTVAQLEQSLGNSGQVVDRFRQSVEESLVLSLLTEFYANNRVFVPEYEVEGAITQNNLGEASTKYQIAHLFIKGLEDNRERAAQIREEIVNGLDFSKAVAQYSDSASAQEGGLIGWRSKNELPELFAVGIEGVKQGGLSKVLESPNGLHILQLVERKGELIEVLQSNVRHILIEAEGDVAVKQASKKLVAIKERILAGEDFGKLARIYSDDSVSAATGGSLEWVNPGQMVKPFQDVYETLAIDQVSDPVVTQFGVHLIQVMDRREENVTEIVMKNRVRGVLRRQRASREFTQWVRQLKEQAYISHVADPSIIGSGDDEKIEEPSA